MKLTRGLRSRQTDLCSFFFFLLLLLVVVSFCFFQAKVWFTLEIFLLGEIQIRFLQVESYKYAMYLWKIIHSTINNRAFKSVTFSEE